MAFHEVGVGHYPGAGIWPVPENHIPTPQELESSRPFEVPDPEQARWLADTLGQVIQSRA
ncbi:hypothetical protein DEDE109153_08885 [Deinococcus deserti]